MKTKASLNSLRYDKKFDVFVKVSGKTIAVQKLYGLSFHTSILLQLPVCNYDSNDNFKRGLNVAGLDVHLATIQDDALSLWKQWLAFIVFFSRIVEAAHTPWNYNVLADRICVDR